MPEKKLYFESPRQLSQLYCSRDENLSSVEETLKVKLVTRDDWLLIESESEDGLEDTVSFFNYLNLGRAQGLAIREADFHHMLQAVAGGRSSALRGLLEEPLVIQTKKRSIVPRTINQKGYIQAIRAFDVVFGIGPAGTGKTYLAVAAAIDALAQGTVERVVLTRPAVEAGEALGFLPGDLQEKIQPYLRPLYDAMHEMLGKESTDKLIEKGAIEIAPLAYMRGRTLSGAFVILDEAQNTTPEQMMMFLTRLGDDSRMVITGDLTQIDLPRPKVSGLRQAAEVLLHTKGIKFFFFEAADVVRHPLVERILEAYETFNNPERGAKSERPARG